MAVEMQFGCCLFSPCVSVSFSYVKYAWGLDELHPKSKKGTNWFALGLTLIDALDTLYIMDMKDEFKVCPIIRFFSFGEKMSQ